MTPTGESRDFSVLRFTAGPPYEDIAFKVVNREWEYSYKHGFRCQFQNGIFQLWFHFKRYRYRRWETVRLFLEKTHNGKDFWAGARSWTPCRPYPTLYSVFSFCVRNAALRIYQASCLSRMKKEKLPLRLELNFEQIKPKSTTKSLIF